MSLCEGFPMPDVEAARIERLCTEARHGGAGVYAALLRENVLDAINCSFPRFCEQLGTLATRQLASDFVQTHPADLPQFHHVATEFVRFAQGQVGLPKVLLCLLEYEWTLLAVEIDAARVPAESAFPEAVSEAWCFACNPTLRVVALPFAVGGTGSVDLAAESGVTHVYAVYRSSRHLVLIRALDRTDCALLDSIKQHGRLMPQHLQAFPGKDGSSVGRWLSRALEHNLILISEKEFQGVSA